MAKEIERKFLVKNDSYKQLASEHRRIVQAYLSVRPESTVRVRVAGDRAWLTVKGRNDGAVRDEWEYPIPVGDALEMIERCAESGVVDKTRYQVGPWEVDEFHGRHRGLVTAEIELDAADDPLPSPLPDYIGAEVTGDPRYYNSVLAGSGSGS